MKAQVGIIFRSLIMNMHMLDMIEVNADAEILIPVSIVEYI